MCLNEGVEARRGSVQELEFQAVVSQQLWVLGTELGPSTKAIEHL